MENNHNMYNNLADVFQIDEPKSSYVSEFNEHVSAYTNESFITKLPPGIGPLTGAITLTIMVVGVVGNLLTIVALLRCPRVRNVAAAFIISLCIADFLFCLTVLPVSAVSFFRGSWDPGEPLCTLMPFIRYGNVGFSLLSIAMITINRYVMIAHYSVYTRVYKPSSIAAMLVFCWFLSFGMQIPTALQKWGKYAYDPELGTCSILQDENQRSSKSALFLIGFVCPCLVIICCYARIFWVVHSSETRMRKHATRKIPGSESNSRIKEKREAKARRNEWRITKMVLAIFLSFILCYLPITVVKLLDSNVYPGINVIAYLLLYLSACMNPIIYVIMNKQYRQAYKTVLMCQRPRLLSMTPGPGSSYGGEIYAVRTNDRINDV
ncbi:G-protein coupled receptor moody isoform X2 [Lycorma delicatula]|uniref:G-protein coupled receptor moody isoform X2 n=1 Tax=Lycorma delicatula TaxID=130591 RepID=UPI003F51534B